MMPMMAVLRSLTTACAPCVTHLTDVHEQRKSWVPLMLEVAYKPSGWLGIMCAMP